MDIQIMKDSLFAQGKELGFTDMEVYYQQGKRFKVTIDKGEVDVYSIAEEGGISFRGFFNGKLGYAYTEKYDQEAIPMLLEEAKENSTLIESEDQEFIFEGSKLYQRQDMFSEALDKMSTEDKIAFLKNVESRSRELDSRVRSINFCLLETREFEKGIANTKGLFKRERGNVAVIFLSVVVQEEGDIKSAMNLSITRQLDSLNPQEIAEKAVEEAISMLGATSVKSKTYPVVLKNKAAASLIQAF